MVSEKITQAILFAQIAHDGQTRKDGKPFIIHPLSVGYILSSQGFSEDVVIAGILHDVVEDTHFTGEDIKEKFGTHVRDLVLGVTEDKTITDWSLRKRAYLDHLETVDTDTQAISAADLLDNRRSLITALKDNVLFWHNFGGSPEMIIKDSRERLGILKKSFNNELILELENLIDTLEKSIV